MTTATQQPYAPGFQPGYQPQPQQQFQQPPMAPQQQSIPVPGSRIQSVDFSTFRWKQKLGQMKACVLKLESLVGTKHPESEDELNNGVLSNDDLMLNEDGTADMDFEESSMETIGEIILEGQKLLQVASDFYYNLNMRPHPTEPTNDSDTQPQG